VMSMIPALISVTGAPISFRAARYDRVAAAETLARKFREPLIQAVFNLETRPYNILKLGTRWGSCPVDIARAA
ncbi:MAG TPA: hypothetical protein VJW23_18830, partial [Propionibacteriaceae bacterium]|nr:hypothetical protein [Propionibacteriaceae bacterium]